MLSRIILFIYVGFDFFKYSHIIIKDDDYISIALLDHGMPLVFAAKISGLSMSTINSGSVT